MNKEEVRGFVKDNVTHIGFIMDGNRRWAVANNLPKIKGHNFGVDALKNILKWQRDLEIETFTFYTLSRDNKRKRGEEEYDNLMNLALVFFAQIENEIESHKDESKKVRISVFGDYEDLRSDVAQKLKEAVEKTRSNRGFNVNFCINYDGQHEIVEGSKIIAQRVLSGEIDVSQINEEMFKSSIYTCEFGAPQIIIRTGDMPRLSGFLLWDSQYSEIYFSPKMWPDFNEKDLFEVIDWFSRIDRKFGK